MIYVLFIGKGLHLSSIRPVNDRDEIENMAMHFYGIYLWQSPGLVRLIFFKCENWFVLVKSLFC